jgi:hypothetical protein
MLRRVALVRTDVPEEPIAAIFSVKRMSEVETTLVTANVVSSLLIFITLMAEVISSSEKSIIIRTTRRHIPEESALGELHCF